MICPYCKNQAEWVANKEVYGRNHGKSYMIWLCRPCDAYVGCHNNTKKPLGTMANKNLRALRVEAKNLFIDKKLSGEWKNKKLKITGYSWLKEVFGREFHFGSSTGEECLKIISLLNKE